MPTYNHTVTFQNPHITNDNFGPQIIELHRVLKELNDHSTCRHFIFDFRNISFAMPIFLSGITAISERLKTTGCKIELQNCSQRYFDRVCLCNAFRPEDHQDWKQILESHQGKTYLPIIDLSNSSNRQAIDIKNQSLSSLSDIITERVELDIDHKMALKYFISEITDNATDHSRTDRTFIFAQYYKLREYIDLCIIDNGIGIRGSYDLASIPVNNDMEAIQKAVAGISTKGKERGYGIHTTMNAVVQGLGGKFALYSGLALLTNTTMNETQQPWQGTFLALRIPKRTQGFRLYDYIAR